VLASGAMDVLALRDLVAAREREFVADLADLVNVDCGTYTPEGVNHIADDCEQRFRRGGWAVDRRRHEAAPGQPGLGDLVIGRLLGGGGPGTLLLGHMDTVFEEGTAAARPFRAEGGRALGPGVSDMKAGLLAGFAAVEALLENGFDAFGAITYVCNPDEEIGSPFSGPVIRELASAHDAALVLECARANGNIVSARKGSTDVAIHVTGRAAHAGVEPEKGRSAVLEAANETVAIQALNGRWDGVTLNVGAIRGGTRPNIVPDHCELLLDVRAPTGSTQDEAERAIAAIAAAPTVEGTTVDVRVSSRHRPMEKTEASQRLVDLATGIASEMGFELHDTATGGASDGNTTSAAGTPTLDGLGPVGGGAHAPDEWLDLSSVVPRVTLLAALIARL
jgi:glutamate carboxypeptidase